MACGCQKNKITADGSPVQPGTFRVQVSGRQVYESNTEAAAFAVGERFTTSEIHAPSGDILTFDKSTNEWIVNGSWLEAKSL